ncbi:purine-cytosine permease family protein [Actinomadura madurae]|uniref:purine-cytosine permease family protein n=1 Tax=Actinomadura madurae TaxID=1993 RepID=UPI0020D2142D|nr:cytosine permease [Actinomadura madurae]MCP9950964.1 cytosine permease [Actinomadura madurae]MCP9967751.1 cytosine permease [Actinomadura madurae]MCP9980199.1 cytosine permease [Actinomadura madurae]MCQ0008276.1 cytosine permease [Actinomadura madurae]MCQ0016412.1 cytosine permease [Actinomadura madurae]
MTGTVHSQAPARGGGSPPLGAEARSIDFIPNEERTGKAWHLGTVWFGASVNLTGLATGFATLSIGASLFWTVVATVFGSLFGTFFMAFHSAQGPQLGLPQLVQSRPQFGYVGAALTVWVFVLVNYVAYNTSDALLSGASANSLSGMPKSLGYLIAALLAAVLAFCGYHWIHRVYRWLMWPMLVLLVLCTYAALTSDRLPSFTPGPFELAPFMSVFVIVAGFQLGWAPYVSDYSRYLPAGVGVRSTLWWTYLPSAISGIWVFVLGSIVSAAVPGADPVTAIRRTGDSLFAGFGAVLVLLMLVGLVAIMAVNQYGGSLTMLSMADSFWALKPTKRARAGSIALMSLVVFGLAQSVGIDRFNEFYGNALVFLAYLFTPWTAVNLVDFFFVRRGKYVIGEIFNPNGIYGRWGSQGITAYLVAIALMVPFMVTTPFTGFLARQLGGVDYSIFVGLPVAGGLYWLLTRNLDRTREEAMVRDEALLPRH